VATLEDLARAYRTAEKAVPAARQAAARAAAAKVAAAKVARDQARERLAAGIVAEYRAGTRQAEIARRTGYSREHVRRILRAAGIEADE